MPHLFPPPGQFGFFWHVGVVFKLGTEMLTNTYVNAALVEMSVKSKRWGGLKRDKNKEKNDLKPKYDIIRSGSTGWSTTPWLST